VYTLIESEKQKEYPVTTSFKWLVEAVKSYDALLFLADRNTETHAKDLALKLDHPNSSIEVLPAGESTKKLSVIEELAEKFSPVLTRSSCVVCVGGGVIGDMGGFLASVLFRGIDYIGVPTSLLSMVDSSVGGKTGVNLKCGKNLVGSFHTPRGIYLDTDYLKTLPEEEFFSGWGEILKSAALEGQVFFQQTSDLFLKSWYENPSMLESAVEASILFKKSVVEQDYRENGHRKILNAGHTVGHALESFYRYSVPHGICVMEGLLMEARIGSLLGLVDKEFSESLQYLFSRFPKEPFDENLEQLLPFMKMDKKNEGEDIHFCFIKRPGKLALPVEYTIGLKPTHLKKIDRRFF
jgi:3-dehydroquinate synthase